MSYILYLALIAIVAYLIGSIPTGYIIVKLKTGQDIREVGSGSTGATNVKRVLGKAWFFIVMILDAIKGALPVVLASYLSFKFGDAHRIAPPLAATCVIIGHSKPLFLGFRGGKSVASCWCFNCSYLGNYYIHFKICITRFNHCCFLCSIFDVCI